MLAGSAIAAGQKKSSRANTHSHEQAGEIAELTATAASGLKGQASFYGPRFTGRKTTTGERFDPRLFTAASNHFALGEVVSVQRLDNSRCAIVRINDRMGARGRRILDVSRGVAEYLDMIQEGVVLVRVAPLKVRAHAPMGCQAAFEPADDCPDCSSAELLRKSPTPSLNWRETSVP